MKKQLLIITLVLLGLGLNVSYSQTVLWSEDFGTPAAGTLANGYVTGNGAWTVTNTGANGADANVWYVSGEECGNAAGVCGSVCSGGDASLHIGSSPTIFGDLGASYLNGGGGFFFPETDKRVESPTIDLTGEANITCTFNYIEDIAGQAGQDPGDDATFWYFDGAIWTQLDPLAITPGGCAPQGTWTAISIALPASADNNPNVKIGFHWFNNDDGVGTDPTIAVDDIQITTPTAGGPTASFTTPITTICEGDCIDFTDLSSFGTNPNWFWTFAGSSTASSTSQNPAGICYPTAGTYTVSLEIVDDNGVDIDNQVNYITVLAAPNAGSDGAGNVCNTGTIDVSSLLSGADAGGTWTETTGTPSGQFVGTTLDGTGLTIGNMYTFEYSVAPTAPCTAPDVAVITITVIDCSAGPTASFVGSNLNICEGDCIDFTDLSALGPNPNWSWTFTGATTGTSTAQNPTNICYPTAGTYQVELTVTDDNGTDTQTIPGYITVTACSGINAGFTPSSMSICVGECITFTDNSTGPGIISYGWDFQNGTPSTFGPSGTFDPGSVCFNTPGTADITLLISDGVVVDQTTITITVNPLPTINAGTDQNVCSGDLVTLTATGGSTYAWDNGVVDGVAFVPTGTATYTVTGTDANGCVNTDQVIVTVTSCVPLVAGFEYFDNLCVGDCITLTDTSSGVVATWLWDFGGGATPNNDTVANPTVCFDAAGSFNIQLTVTDASGASASTTNTITVFDSPSVSATTVLGMPDQDTLIDLAGSADLIATLNSPGTILWTPSNSVDCDTCSATFASPVDSTWYFVTLTDINGCQGVDSVFVRVNFIKGIGVPDAFSPNGDGNNDALYVLGEGIVSLSFKVYNRYGQLVFETSDQSIGWDGKFHDREENSGVFTWVLEYTFINGQGGLQKGNTTLIR